MGIGRAAGALLLIASAACRAQVITTVAGGGGNGLGDLGKATAADLSEPTAVAVDSAGNLYIADYQAHRIRKVNGAGIISTIAGTGTAGYSGDGGPATAAMLRNPWGVAVDNTGAVYIADKLNHRIRRVTPDGNISTYAGSGAPGFSGDGGPATAARLYNPSGVAIDIAGNLYIADTQNHRVRRVNAAGMITTVVGSGSPSLGGDGNATSVPTPNPTSVAVDSAGNLYLTDGSHKTRKVTPAGALTTIAGTGTPSFSGDGGPATGATLSLPSGVAVDNAGNVYISDTGNNRVRKVNAGGVISTYAGGGKSTGDGGPAASAGLNLPEGLALDAAGNLFIADSNLNRIREVAAPTGGPAITLVANAFGEARLIAPNTWVEIKGSSLAPAGDTRIWQSSDFAGGSMPTSLDGVNVTVNGKSAFVYYISPTQLNILTPPDALSGSVEVKVTNRAGTATATVLGAQYSPSFFVFDATHATAIHADGSLIGPASLYPGYSTPARPGESIILYANGLGPTLVPVVSGSPTQSGSLAVMPAVLVGGIPATVQFAGLISPGLYQLNVIVPVAAANGDNGLTGASNGQSMQSGVTLAVQR